MATKQMWVARDFEHSGRRLYKKGEVIDLPFDTQMDTDEIESLKRFGLVSETEVAPD